MTKTNKGKTISIRLSESMLSALDKRAASESKDRTQLIREAISKELDLPEVLIEERLDTLEKLIETLKTKLKTESERNDSMEVRLGQLDKIINVLLGETK